MLMYSVATETADAYGTVSDGLSKTGVPGLASDRGTTHVFRAGDYNVEGRPGSYVSVHMSDFGQQTAAGVSTVIPKAYGHVLPKLVVCYVDDTGGQTDGRTDKQTDGRSETDGQTNG